MVFVTPTFVSTAKARKIEVWSYDSNNRRDLEYAVACGIRGLIVDHPREAMAQFFERSESQ